MLAWGLAQLGGSLVLLWQPVLPHPGFVLLSLPVALAAFASPRWRWLAAIWLGAALAGWHAAATLEDRLDAALDGKVIDVTGRIVGLVEVEPRRMRFLFEIESGLIDGRAIALPRRVRLSLYDDLAIATGERWRWRVKLRRARGFANPGTFDYERWLFAKRIGATGYVRDVNSAQRLQAAAGEWRAAIARRVEKAVDGPAAGLLRGLATADRAGIDDAQWELLRMTGTAHLVSISGLHIVLVAGLGMTVAGFARRWWFPAAAVRWAPLVGGALAFAYGAMAGFGIPVQRSLAGAAVVLGALALRRAVRPGHAYGLALTVVLCLDPLAPLDIGFWLSFGAVAAIVYLLAGRRPLHAAWRRATRVQLGLFLLLAPATLLAFGQVPLVSPLANAIAIPLFGFAVVPLVLIGVALLGWPMLAGAVFAIAGWLLELLLDALGWLAELDPGVAPGVPDPVAWLLGVIGLCLVVAPRAIPGRALALVLLLPATLQCIAGRPDPPPLALHFLDVGQGLAVVVETPAHTLVYDTGPAFGDTDAARLVVVPFIHARGRTPDIVMISHSDNDHAGGMKTVEEAFADARLVGRAPGTAKDCAGMSWQWESVRFDVLHPGVSDRGDENDASCVLRIEWRDHVVLLTGDIEAAAEARLLEARRDALDADIVLVPHHGSMTSSTAAFVAAVRPEIAIAAAGFHNRWGFPRAPVVARWRTADARVITTGGQGAITVTFGEKGSTLRAFRAERRLWREPPAGDDKGFP